MDKVLGSKRALAVAIAIPLVFAALSLGLGFVTDDQGFRAVLHAGARPAWDLFGFQRGDVAENALAIRHGHLAWWAAPDLKIHFLRPLTGILFAADDRVFGDAALGYHVHSLLWFALLLAGVAALYRAILPPAAATLGVAIFGLAAAHTDAFAWLSARHVLVGGAGAAWALAIYVRAPGKRRWLGLVPLAIGLCGSEAALGAIPIWCALVMWREPAWRARLRECAPAIVLGVAYLVAYTALGGGTRGSDGYHDPFADPLGFCALAMVRVPILLGDAALAIPAELSFVASHAALAVAGVVAVGVVAIAWRSTRPHDRLLLILALGGLVAVLPGVAGYPAGRVLVVPDVAFAAVLGAILARAGAASFAGKLACGVVAVAHLIWSPLLELHDQHALARRGRFVERVAREVTELVPPGSRAIIVAASDPFVFMYPRAVLAEESRGTVTCWSVLSAAQSRHRVTRTGEHDFTVEAIDRPLLDGSFDALFRSPDRPFSVGDTVDQCGATIRIAALEHGLPSRLAISYQRRLDDPKLAFLAWRDHHLQRFTLPALGESIELPASKP
ncbi:MAG TPA: hypothetical protein VGL61_01110 [Kofleriaceae bacterium]|jgi:hypothetical protein